MNEIIKSLYNRKSMRVYEEKKVHSAGDEEGHP